MSTALTESTRTQAKTRVESDSMGKIEVPGECLLGGADAAFAAAFQHWARHHASGADSRPWHAQEGLRAGKSGLGQTSRLT